MSQSLNKPRLDNLAGDIWKSAERLRGKFKAYEYQAVILPTEQDEICHFLDVKLRELRRIGDGITAQIETLTAYRKSLIHECVTGQRRVTEEDLRRVCGDRRAGTVGQTS